MEKMIQTRQRQLEELAKVFQGRNYDSGADMLEKIAVKGILSHELWFFRKFFFEIPSEELQHRPLLLAAQGLVYMLEHRPELAEACVAKASSLPTRPAQADALYALTLCYRLYQSTLHPGKLLSQLRTIACSMNGDTQPCAALTLTATCPSVYDGFFDFSRYQRHSRRLHQPVSAVLAAIYGQSAEAAADIMQAEILYQSNRLIEAFSLITSAANTAGADTQSAEMTFTMLFIQLKVLTVTGQCQAFVPIVVNIRDKIMELRAWHLLPSVTALHIWALLYERDTGRIRAWLEHEAPDENGDFNFLDQFAYMVKMRVYLALGKFLLAVRLGEKLRPVLQRVHKLMKVCEVNMLLAMAYEQLGEQVQATACLDRSLLLAEKHGFHRLLADEGEVLHRLLCRYAHGKKPDKTKFVNKIIDMSLDVALLYPQYLRLPLENRPKLTRKQLTALRLCADHHTTESIATMMQVSKATVTGYFRRIFATLGVNSRQHAVSVARELNLLG